MRISVTYDRLSAQAVRKVICPGCNRPRTTQRTFHQTVNPFNKNPDGSAKTYGEVQAAVSAEAQAWEPSGRDLYHGACWEE